MKMTTLVVTMVMGSMIPLAALAEDQFLLTWRGTAYSTNASGGISSRRFSESDIVRQVAIDNGIDPSTLAFVYRVNARDTVVARRSDGAFVADVIQMQYVFTDVVDAANTRGVRQALLNDEYHDNPIGSAFGTERMRWSTNGVLTSFSFQGSFQYANPESRSVYTGTFRTGKRLGL